MRNGDLHLDVNIFRGEGEVSTLMRSFDWSATPVGSPGGWPRSLQSIVRMLLTTRYQMWMAWGPDLTFICNDAYRPTLGVKFPWAIGQSARDVWSEIWPDIGPLIDHVLRTGEATYSEGMLLLLERSGFPEETYHTFSYSPLFSDDGAIAGMLCVVVEETERVINERRIETLRELASAAAAAKAEENLFRSVASALSANPRDLPFSLIYVVDEAGEAARIAISAGIEMDHEAVAEFARAELSVGSASEDAVTELRSVTLGPLYGALPAGVWKFAPQQALIAPIAQQGGERQPAGFLVVGLNPYRPLDNNYKSFVGLVAGQLGAALAGVRAYEAERRRAEALAEIDRAKTTFFSNVSHEFRTPLTLLLGPLEELLSETEMGGQARQQAEIAHRNGIRLLRLVNSLLDFSRIEAGRAKATYVPMDIVELTREIASSFRSALEKANLQLTLNSEPLAEPLFVDPDMWEKILLNLISNAFKFTFEGGVSIRVARSADGKSAEVSVTDTGIGIAAHELPKLFERFHRVEGAKGRSFEGSGIGLALVQELVKLHGGSITLQSEPNSGTTFALRLPFGSAHLPQEHVREGASTHRSENAQAFVAEALRWLPREALPDSGDVASSGKATSAKRAGSGKRIVLADDNADMRDYVRRLLLAEDYQVDAVENGEAALQAARTRHCDLILTDVMMPVMDGFEVLQAVRRDASLSGTPVVLLSARAGEEAKIEGLDAGADDYLTKPFAARELLARVGTNIQLATLRKEAERALRLETRALGILNRTGTAVAGDLELETIVQTITDAGVQLTGAEFGAFFYNVTNAAGDSYMLYSLSGVPREAFSKFPMPRNTDVFSPTFSGEGIVRSDDITKDPRYGHNAPHRGMPEGHLPVRSYLAVPVKSRDGSVLGGLFFGHSEVGIFTERAEEFMASLSAQAAVAIDNARLFQAAQKEISHRVEAEKNLQTLNVSLREQVSAEVAERMKAEEALRQSQKMEAIGQLTGGIAHDFNNLLAGIIGSLDLLERRLAEQRYVGLERYISGAQTSARRAASLTQRLLAFSRRQTLDPKPTDINRLIGGMEDLIRRTVGPAITVEVVGAGGLWSTRVDPAQLENALLNLCINARDAMPDGGRITIETANKWLDDREARIRELAPGQYISLCVTDTGTGMTPEVISKAFDPFFTTKPLGKGTGLGLSMIHGFVRQSGGQVRIYSELGKGTTMCLYFPRNFGGTVDADGPQAAALSDSGRGETILVVDDEALLRMLMTEMLHENGYAILEAVDGPSGLKILQSDVRIDLLVTDVGLPGGMNGRGKRVGLKVLFVTGYAENAAVGNGLLEAGMHVVAKPFDMVVFSNKVRELIEG